MQIPQHIIISRTDNIGDVVLTLPMAALLKQRWPTCKISFLTRKYVADIISACPDVDAFINWDELQTLSCDVAAEKLANADVILHVYPRKQIAKLAKRARIKTRIGTTHRLYHWLTCNKKVNFTRKNSSQHEAQLNLALLAPLGLPTHLDLAELTTLTHLKTDATIKPAVKKLCVDNKFNLVMHPLTNGNTKEWPLEKFSQLIETLDLARYNIIITGTPNELSRLTPFLAQHPTVKNAVGTLTLTEFINLLGHVDGLVVNSTGPLHIAAALGTHVLGLFPPDPGKDPGRWGPLGKHASVLTAQPNTAPDISCMDNISVAAVQAHIETWH